MHLINILMQLRKVCNHPNLFAEAAVVSPAVVLEGEVLLAVPGRVMGMLTPNDVIGVLGDDARPSYQDLVFLNLCLLHNEVTMVWVSGV